MGPVIIIGLSILTVNILTWALVFYFTREQKEVKKEK